MNRDTAKLVGMIVFALLAFSVGTAVWFVIAVGSWQGFKAWLQ